MMPAPEQRLAGEVEQRRPHRADEQRLADVGLGEQKPGNQQRRQHGDRQRRHVLARLALGEEPCGDDDKGRLHELRRLQRMSAIDSQRRAPWISGPMKCTAIMPPSDSRNSSERHAAHAARRDQRHRQHDEDAGGREQQVALDEIVGRQPLPDGDGRACREREYEARADDRQDRAEQHVVDGEPPVANAAAVGARDPHAALPLRAMPGSAETSARKASPRTSKLRYWSKEAHAGDSSTTGSRASLAAASRAAAATAASSVPQRSKATSPSSVAANSSVASPIR